MPSTTCLVLSPPSEVDTGEVWARAAVAKKQLRAAAERIVLNMVSKEKGFGRYTQARRQKVYTVLKL